MNTIEEKTYQLLVTKINELGYKLISVSYQREGRDNYLRITIDKDDDIALDDIVNISNLISPILDVSEIISDKYILDVSSLGAEKEIDINKLDKYVGKYLNIHLTHPYKGLNNLIGTLTFIDSVNVQMEYKEKTRTVKVVLERKYIDKAHLAIKF